jgi:hypothetical protein
MAAASSSYSFNFEVYDFETNTLLDSSSIRTEELKLQLNRLINATSFETGLKIYLTGESFNIEWGTRYCISIIYNKSKSGYLIVEPIYFTKTPVIVEDISESAIEAEFPFKLKNSLAELISTAKKDEVVDLEVVKKMVDEMKKKFGFQASMNSILRVSLNRRRFEVFELLIDNGADIHFDNDFIFKTTILENRLAEVKYLIEEHGIDPHCEDDYAIKNATARGFSDIVRYLKSRH